MNHTDNRRVKITKQLFQDSLLELLDSQSIHEISIRTLCEKADLNRSTFYKYYGSQYDLLKEIEDKVLNQITKTFSKDTSLSTYKEQLTQLLTFVLEHENISKLLLNANTDPDFPKRLLNLPALHYALNIATQGTTSKEILYKQDFFFYGGYQVIKRWLNSEERETPEEIAEFFTKFINTQ